MSDGQFCFDASALAKLILRNEPGAEAAAAIWNNDEYVVHCSILAYPETYSAIVRAHRDRRLVGDLMAAFEQFERIWRDTAVIGLTPEIAQQAREIVRRYALSGADAVHVASAFAAGADADISFVTWDQRQAAAASDLGLTVTPAPG